MSKTTKHERAELPPDLREILERNLERLAPFIGKALVPGSAKHRRFLRAEQIGREELEAWRREHCIDNRAQAEKLWDAWLAAPSGPERKAAGRAWLAAHERAEFLDTPGGAPPATAPVVTPSDLEGEWSLPMSKTEMRTRLQCMTERKFKSFAKQHGLKWAGNRQLWQIRLDGMDSNTRHRLAVGRPKA